MIELKKKYESQIIFLKGNHEQVFLEAVAGGFRNEMNKMVFAHYFDEFRKEGTVYIQEHHLKFLKELKDFHVEDNLMFVHGGVNQKGNPDIWEYGINGDLPEGIDFIIRSRQMVDSIKFYKNNINIDTAATKIWGRCPA